VVHYLSAEIGRLLLFFIDWLGGFFTLAAGAGASPTAAAFTAATCAAAPDRFAVRAERTAVLVHVDAPATGVQHVAAAVAVDVDAFAAGAGDVTPVLVAPVELDVRGRVLLISEWVLKAGDLHVGTVSGPGIWAEQRQGITADKEDKGGQYQ